MILNYSQVIELTGLVDVQFRMREYDNLEDWETIKVSFMAPVHSPSDAERIARDLLRNLKNEGLPVLQEIRWNRAGSPKGHVIKNTLARYPRLSKNSDKKGISTNAKKNEDL